ncbi:MAG TPA: NlpC/P60 family protein [Sporichthya sp.]|nr:NlpC/P60 family protein [Sporichthya sp.]
MRKVALVAGLTLAVLGNSALEGRAAEPAYLQPVTTITPPKGCVVLTAGMNGVKVRMVQQRLGMPDWAWETMDARTREKVKRFQKRKGLAVDGVVGAKTWAAMGLAEDFCMDRWTATPAVGLDATSAQRIRTMIRFARTYLGSEYVWGGAGTPQYGIDCSGLVLQGLYRAGLDPQPITLDKHVRPAYRSSVQLYKHPGLAHLPFAERQRGDLIFYRSNSTGKVNHIGIYLGDDRILEAVSGPDTTRIGTVTRYRYGQTVMPTVVRPFP